MNSLLHVPVALPPGKEPPVTIGTAWSLRVSPKVVDKRKMI
jgi:hypothetical protein